MGLLTSLLTFPVSGPAKGTWWVIEQIAAVAEAELYDEGTIVEQLRALHAQIDAGEINAAEHAAAEAVLLERLVEARARRAEHPQEA